MAVDPDNTANRFGEQAALTEYGLLGEYDNQSSASFAQVGAVGTVVLSWFIIQEPSSLATNPFIRSIMPALPLVFLAFLVHLTGGHLIRLKHYRDLERTLEGKTNPSGEDGSSHTLKLARLSGANVALPMRIAGGVGGFITYSMIAIFAYAVSIREIHRLATYADTLSSWMALLYCGVLTLLAAAHLTQLLSPDKVVKFAHSQLIDHASTGRIKVLKYLLPRPNDLQKFSAMAIGFIVSVSIFGLSCLAACKLFSAYLLFDLIFYQGRYLWNDLRGLQEDAEHPGRAIRTRWATGANAPTEIRLACMSILARLSLFFTLTFTPHFFPFFDARDREVLLFAALLATITAVMYETTRSKNLSPAETTEQSTRASAIILSGLLVISMTIRAGIGFAMGTPNQISLAAAPFDDAHPYLVTAIFTCLAVALLSVGLNCVTWSLEACAAAALPAEQQATFLAMKPHVWYFGWSSGLWTPPHKELAFYLEEYADAVELHPFANRNHPLPGRLPCSGWLWLTSGSIVAFTAGLASLGMGDDGAFGIFYVVAIFAPICTLFARDFSARRFRRRSTSSDLRHSRGISPGVAWLPPALVTIIAAIVQGVPPAAFIPVAIFGSVVVTSAWMLLEQSYRRASQGVIQTVVGITRAVAQKSRIFLRFVIGERAAELLLSKNSSSNPSITP